jgi:hypothetical protein
MKNKFLPLFVGMFLASTMVFSQGKCGTYDGSLEEQMQKYPAFYQGLEDANSELETEYKSAISKMKNLKVVEGKKIIPVVVHVVHDFGGENISDAAIQGALDILNANMNGQSANFLAKTPDIFASVRGDLGVEFRLAKIDPSGNPTTGIIRIQSELTDQPEPRDVVKSLSYWNSYQYFNIWTLKRFAPQDDGNTLLGYAQFPETGRMSTDGVVLLASQMASGGTLTHECGHWLGLRHTWGDADCGDDGVKDTPPAKDPNFGINLSDFPYHVGECIADSLNPAGEMFVNYMDYSSDADVTMFTKGQNGVMNETLEGIYDEDAQVSGIGFREFMWSADNITATGVADAYLTPICKQNANFASSTGKYSMCLGENIVLKGNETQFSAGTVSSITWDYGDGNTDSSNANLVAHTYDAVGSYDVSITIEYDETTEARAATLADLDLVNATSYDSIVETLNVQGTEAELLSMNASNINLHLDDDGYSINSIWVRNQFTTDNILDASHIDTLESDSTIKPIIIYINYDSGTSYPDSVLTGGTDSIWIHINGSSLSAQEDVLLASADSVWTTDINIGYLNTIVDYSFYFDTTVLNLLTFIDSTYLSASDSVWLDGADSSWSVDGILASDSITVYFAQFNMDTTITLSINIDTNSLTVSDSLMFNNADSTWNTQTTIGSVDTVRTYHTQFNYPTYNGYYIDTLFYRGELDKITYIAYYENSCSSTTLKENIIIIDATSSSNTAGDYTYSFEDASVLSADWHVNETVTAGEWGFNTIENATWKKIEGVAVSGNASLMIDRDELTLGSDELISVAYDLSDLTSPAIKFSYSGASANTFPVNELNVFYSNDCGEVWKTLGSLTTVQVANAGLYTGSFKPVASEWNDTVMTKSQLKNDNIKFKFEYVTNGAANNFYLDNIMIGEESTLLIAENTTTFKFSVFPNPAKESVTVSLENLADKNVEVQLVNILGAEVMNLFKGEVVSDYYVLENIDLSHLETGIYFVKVVANGDIISTEKLILNK